MIQAKVLEKIYQHLQRNPGEFKWSPIAVILEIELLEMYEHLKWLRENEFIKNNNRARVYWGDRSLDEFQMALLSIPKTVKKAKKVRISIKKKTQTEECVKILNSMCFVNWTLADIYRRVPKFDPKILKSALIRSGASVAWCRKRKEALYLKSSSTGTLEVSSGCDRSRLPPRESASGSESIGISPSNLA